MESSILKSTKKILGIHEDYDAFDQDVLTFINTAFSSLHQLGVGPESGFQITDDTTTWESYTSDQVLLGYVRTYIYLRVRLAFDPPTTSFLIEAVKDQLREYEWRVSTYRESLKKQSEVS